MKEFNHGHPFIVTLIFFVLLLITIFTNQNGENSNAKDLEKRQHLAVINTHSKDTIILVEKNTRTFVIDVAVKQNGTWYVLRNETTILKSVK